MFLPDIGIKTCLCFFRHTIFTKATIMRVLLPSKPSKKIATKGEIIKDVGFILL